jgi:hypothetical protein
LLQWGIVTVDPWCHSVISHLELHPAFGVVTGLELERDAWTLDILAS